MKKRPLGAAVLSIVFAICFVASCWADPPELPQARYDRDTDRHGFTVFMRDGGWCWFQDPRVILHRGKLLIGSVKGSDTGPAFLGVYDLQEEKPLGTVLMQDDFDHDDHNSPVFFARPDGSVLTVYAKHGREESMKSTARQSA